jgi:hypothetical protein
LLLPAEAAPHIAASMTARIHFCICPTPVVE